MSSRNKKKEEIVRNREYDDVVKHASHTLKRKNEKAIENQRDLEQKKMAHNAAKRKRHLENKRRRHQDSGDENFDEGNYDYRTMDNQVITNNIEVVPTTIASIHHSIEANFSIVNIDGEERRESSTPIKNIRNEENEEADETEDEENGKKASEEEKKYTKKGKF